VISSLIFPSTNEISNYSNDEVVSGVQRNGTTHAAKATNNNDLLKAIASVAK
jgi:hypothetical protein